MTALFRLCAAPVTGFPRTIELADDESCSPEKVRPGTGREAGLDHAAPQTQGKIITPIIPDSGATGLYPGYGALNKRRTLQSP